MSNSKFMTGLKKSRISKNGLTFEDSVGRLFRIGFDEQPNTQDTMPSVQTAIVAPFFVPNLIRARCVSAIDHETLDLCGYVNNKLSRLVVRVLNGATTDTQKQNSQLAFLNANVVGNVVALNELSVLQGHFMADVRVESNALHTLW